MMFQVVILLFSCVLSVICPPDTEQSLDSKLKSLQGTIDVLVNDLSNERAKLSNLERQMDATRVCKCVGDEFPYTKKVTTTLPADCWGHKMRNSAATTGWYKIQSPLGKRKPLSVYCDMDTAGGGWTVFQRRIDGSENFNRSYDEYRKGFGNRAEFWLGNDAVHALTLDHPQQLRVDLCDWDGNTVHATYQSFSVGPGTDWFRLNAEGYRGNAGNALDGHGKSKSNQRAFSAPGSDNDGAKGDCAKSYSGGWWFNDCFGGHLNGVYCTEPTQKQVPDTREKWEQIQSEFLQKWQFPNCIGAIDGKHIGIKAPAHSGSEFFNYKKFFSIILLALVDANYKFIFVDIGANGRVGDAAVYANSQLSDVLDTRARGIPPPQPLPGRQEPVPSVVVGDDAFGLKPYLMKPYPFKNLTDEKKIFNYRLSRARRVSENAFGILSNRFAVLGRPLQVSPEVAISVVKATVALHNFLQSVSDSTYQENIDMTSETRMPSINLRPGNHHANDAIEIRNEFADYFINNGQTEWQWDKII